MTLAREMLAQVPGDAQRQTRARVNALVFARRLAAHGDLPRASRLADETITLVEAMVARHPDNVMMAVNRLEILVGAADLAHRQGELVRAVALCREVLASVAKLPGEAVRLRDVRTQTAEAKGGAGVRDGGQRGIGDG